MTQLFQSTYDGYINLITVDLTAHGDQVYGFVDSSNLLAQVPELSTISWNGQTFDPVPFSSSGYQRGGDALVKPTLALPDFGAAMYVTLANYGYATGSPVTRYQALAADILANDPNAPFMEEQYLINSVTFDGMLLSIELATHFDYQRVQFPAHIMYRSEYPGLGSQLASS